MFFSRTKEIEEQLDVARKTAKLRYAAFRDEQRRNEELTAEIVALKAKISEREATLCAKQKELDTIAKDNGALRAQVAHMRNYIDTVEKRYGNRKAD